MNKPNKERHAETDKERERRERARERERNRNRGSERGGVTQPLPLYPTLSRTLT